MKILASVKEGLSQSLKSWRMLIIIWLVSLLLASMIAVPARSSMSSGLGRSMVTEKLKDGINLEVLTDMGSAFRSILSGLTMGMIMLAIVSFLANSFFTGGLFSSLSKNGKVVFIKDALRESAARFRPFLIITLIMSFIIFLIFLLIFVLPFSIAVGTETISEAGTFRIGIICAALYIVVLSILLLVADYARAWQVANEKNNSFKALGFGFKQTFRTFLLSFPMMLMLIMMQAAFTLFAFMAIGSLNPHSQIGLFVMIILSQGIYFIRLFLRSWRYGSVTSMMEFSNETEIL